MSWNNLGKLNERPIAMTDLETSGDMPCGCPAHTRDPQFSNQTKDWGKLGHEILEIGLVVFDQSTFEILSTYEAKVKPLHIENAVPAALERNGYKEEDWQTAIFLEQAMQVYGEKTKDCIFCAYNVSFDWSFVNQAFWQNKIQNPMSTRENHDRLDLLSIAWERGLKKEKNLSLQNACQLFGVPSEPFPHSALNGAMTAYELF